MLGALHGRMRYHCLEALRLGVSMVPQAGHQTLHEPLGFRKLPGCAPTAVATTEPALPRALSAWKGAGDDLLSQIAVLLNTK